MGQVKSPLECVECHKRLSYEDAAGWQAYIAGDPDIEDDEEIVIYCPACARREFGPFSAGSGSLEDG
jgi:hypothetical protein